MNGSKFIAIALAFLICGCQCRNNDIVQVNFMENNDKLLNCRQLEYKLLDIENKLLLLHKQSGRIDAYSDTPLCLVSTELAIQKGKQNAEAQIHYLNDLLHKKNCKGESPTTQKSGPLKTEDLPQENLVKIPLG